MRVIALAILIATVGPALAQGDPSARNLIDSLRPRGDGGERGFRLTPRPPPTSPVPDAPETPRREPSTAQAPRLRNDEAAPAVNLSVQFRSGSAELAPAARRTLDELGKALSDRSLAPYRFRIEGHTDAVGDTEANRILSERRAAAVVTYLNTRFGVDRAKLDAVGMGEDALLVPTGPETPEPRNRRVQVINVGT